MRKGTDGRFYDPMFDMDRDGKLSASEYGLYREVVLDESDEEEMDGSLYDEDDDEEDDEDYGIDGGFGGDDDFDEDDDFDDDDFGSDDFGDDGDSDGDW